MMASTCARSILPSSAAGMASAAFIASALEGIADQALLRGTGARGLRAILEEVLLNVMYDLPGRTDIAKCVIDGTVVADKVNPTLVPRGEARPTRPRRAAS